MLRKSSGTNSVTKAMTCRSGLSALNSSQHFRVLQVLPADRPAGFAASAASFSGSALAPAFSGATVDGDDILAALEQRFQHGLAEGLLAVNDDTHSDSLPNSSVPGACSAKRWRARDRISSRRDARIARHSRGRLTSALRRLCLLLRRGERAGRLDLGDLLGRVAEHLGQDLVGVLAEQRRALHLGRSSPTS